MTAATKTGAGFTLVEILVAMMVFLAGITGVLALMTNVVAVSNVQDIIKLGGFVVASYLGLAIMFGVHAVLLTLNGINPLRFFRKVWPALSFAFTSRSSAATIPLSIEAQTRRIGVPESIASFAASFGTTIGQNGCAGLYPAMLAVMVAPTVVAVDFACYGKTTTGAQLGALALACVGVWLLSVNDVQFNWGGASVATCAVLAAVMQKVLNSHT